jgi:hypothetical protein
MTTTGYHFCLHGVDSSWLERDHPRRFLGMRQIGKIAVLEHARRVEIEMLVLSGSL